MSTSLIHKLELVGFTSFNTRRLGPCHRCEQTLLTYYIPEERLWLCEECYYSNPENVEFINVMLYQFNRTNMASQTDILARLEALEKENAQLKAKATDNIFVGGTDNLTLKHRTISQRGWLVPTKNQNGQGFMRAGDFPMGYFLDQSGTKVILHQEIPISPREAQLFKDRFLSQQIVIAKRREQTQATAQASTPPIPVSTPIPAASVAPTKSDWRKLTELSGDEKQALLTEARELVSGGMYSSAAEALTDVLAQHKIQK